MSTLYHKDKKGNFDYAERRQGGSTVFLERGGKQIGKITPAGRTLDPKGHILNSQPRPDLILAQPRRK
jgi:hypothetical protein